MDRSHTSYSRWQQCANRCCSIWKADMPSANASTSFGLTQKTLLGLNMNTSFKAVTLRWTGMKRNGVCSAKNRYGRKKKGDLTVLQAPKHGQLQEKQCHLAFWTQGVHWATFYNLAVLEVHILCLSEPEGPQARLSCKRWQLVICAKKACITVCPHTSQARDLSQCHSYASSRAYNWELSTTNAH